MSEQLPPNIWFVRSNGGSGSYPVTPEGWCVVRRFIAGMFGWGMAAAALVGIGLLMGPMWVAYTAPVFFALGALLSAWAFISTARKHTDYSITYNEYVRSRSGGAATK